MQCLYLHVMCVSVACLYKTPYRIGCTAVMSVCGDNFLAVYHTQISM
jgi:hypothetical protein